MEQKEGNRDSSFIPEVSEHTSTHEVVTPVTPCTTQGAAEIDEAVGEHATADEVNAARELREEAVSAAAMWPQPGPIQMEILGEDGHARACRVKLPHGVVETPLFMPVGTNGALKGIYPQLLQCIDAERQSQATVDLPGVMPTSLTQYQSEESSLNTPEGVGKQKIDAAAPSVPSWFSGLILGNAFHLHRHVGVARMEETEKGLHNFMGWQGNILTDSGGFQMVSLSRLIDVHEEGVCFRIKELDNPRKSRKRRAVLKGGQRISQAVPGEKEPHPLDKTTTRTLENDTSDEDNDDILLLTPEESIRIQNAIGSDIMMQMDDVVASKTPDRSRVEDAMYRSIRWLDRCIVAHRSPESQCLFGIVQGGLDENLRKRALSLIRQRQVHGYAIGGLSGGEKKSIMWKIIRQCTKAESGLPRERLRYLMGVGYPLDIVVSVALGCDMFDCVFPCRTARFGTALTRSGSIRIKNKKYALDLAPVDPQCACYTCKSYSRAFLHAAFSKTSAVGQLLTIHNLFYLHELLTNARESIRRGKFKDFVCDFLLNMFPRQVFNNGESEHVSHVEEHTQGNNDSVETDANAKSVDDTAEESFQETTKPPLWVRDALASVGIDISHLYSSFSSLD